MNQLEDFADAAMATRTRGDAPHSQLEEAAITILRRIGDAPPAAPGRAPGFRPALSGRSEAMQPQHSRSDSGGSSASGRRLAPKNRSIAELVQERLRTSGALPS